MLLRFIELSLVVVSVWPRVPTFTMVVALVKLTFIDVSSVLATDHERDPLPMLLILSVAAPNIQLVHIVVVLDDLLI